MTQTPFEGPFFVGIDLGGTNVKVGVVDDLGRTLATSRIPTHAERGPEAGLRRICQAVEKLIEESPIEWDDVVMLGVAAPGTMDIAAGMLLFPHNLPEWRDVPIRQRISDHFSKPAILQNDANAAAYGEFWVGAGQSAHSLVMWTLGTGIGCGIIIGDLILEGEHSHGSECGHIVIEMTNGRLCATGQYGTLEAYAGGRSLVNRCREILESGRQTVLKDWIEAGEELTPLLIARAAEQEDPLADQLVLETAQYLGVGTTSVMHTINPDMFLFGGAMTFGGRDSPLGRRFLGRIVEEVKARAFPIPFERTIIDFAALGNNAGYIGAAGCARLHFRRGLGNRQS